MGSDVKSAFSWYFSLYYGTRKGWVGEYSGRKASDASTLYRKWAQKPYTYWPPRDMVATWYVFAAPFADQNDRYEMGETAAVFFRKRKPWKIMKGGEHQRFSEVLFWRNWPT